MAVESAAEEDNRERLRAFDAAVAHRDAMHRLAGELKAAFAVDELARIVAEMNQIGDTYEAWLRADTARLQARNDQRAAKLRDVSTIV